MTHDTLSINHHTRCVADRYARLLHAKGRKLPVYIKGQKIYIGSTPYPVKAVEEMADQLESRMNGYAPNARSVR